MNEKENLAEFNALDFDEEFIRLDSLICEHDSLGDVPLRKGEPAFQWGNVEKACVELLRKANDIRVAIWYLRACIARRGVAGLADGIGCLAGIMSLPIDEIQPRALPGESPREMHVLHLGWISSASFLHQCRQARFEERGITLDELARGEVAEKIPGESEFNATANIVLPEIRESVLRIAELTTAVERPFDLSRVLGLLDAALAHLNPTDRPADRLAARETERAIAATEQAKPLRARSELTTREDVDAALECIAEYFRIHEPSHPAPIFLSRIRRMLGAGFEEMMAELYADGAALAAQLSRPGAVAR
nr:type VI secretion system ImpA family N-terminal domain-containing protein [Burkholderia guangdongensis]